MLIKSLPDEGFNYCLAADIEILGRLVEFLQHRGSQIDIDALNGLHHSTLALEESGDVLAFIGEPRNRIGGNGLGGFRGFLQSVRP